MSQTYIQIDHNLHMKADIGRNPSEAFDFHSIVMTMIMRMQRRKNNSIAIYSEQKVGESESIADIQVFFKDSTINYEIQKEISKEWENFIRERDLDTDTNTNTIPIPIKQLEKKYSDLLVNLRKDLEKYVI